MAYKMTNRTLTDELERLIKDIATSENNPAPMKCEVIKNYSSDPYVDIRTVDGDIPYVEKIGGNSIGARGIVFFLDGDLNSPFAIIERD